MDNIAGIVVVVVAVVSPVLAWVMRVERKITKLCTTMEHICRIVERRAEGEARKTHESI